MRPLPATGSSVDRCRNPAISGPARAMTACTSSPVSDEAWSASLRQTSVTQMASGSSGIVFTIHTSQPGRSATRPADSKRISSSASLCPGCAFLIPQSPNRLTAPLLTPLNARARSSGCRPNDSWVELDTESQHQTKDNPAEYDQQRNAEDLDQRGLQGLSGIVGPGDRPPVDIDCAHAGSDERDERQQRPEHQRLPRRSGALGREIGTRGETELCRCAQTIHVASGGVRGATRDAATAIVPDKRAVRRIAMQSGQMKNSVELEPAQDPGEP